MRYLLVIFILFSLSVKAQNLVPNGSFDDLRVNRPTMRPWKKINTVDFFVNSEEKRYKEVNAARSDRNYILRKPRSGHAYVGIRIWPKYNEYLQVPLRRTLSEKKAYSFEMYVTPSRYSNCYLKKIGASFYGNRPPYMSREGRENFPPQVEVYKPFGVKDTTEWIRINGVFVAKGGEKVLTVGNFSTTPKEKFKRKKFSFKKREAYYYIDDISVYELDEKGDPILDSATYLALMALDSLDADTVSPELEHTAYFTSIDSSITNIYFAENSSKIDDHSYRKLGIITEFLYENPTVKIRVESYASPGEADGQELKLAEKRLRNVSNFFFGNKIEKERVIPYPVGNNCEYNRTGDPKRRFCRKVEIILLP